MYTRARCTAAAGAFGRPADTRSSRRASDHANAPIREAADDLVPAPDARLGRH